MKVIVMRGPSGSGKTWWGKGFVRGLPAGTVYLPCSADDYQVEEGRYVYRPERADDAHRLCLLKFVEALRAQGSEKPDVLLVDNTNTTAAELAPYYQLALAYGVDCKIVRVHAPFEVCVARNVHGVPPSTIWRHFQNILQERLPGRWREEVVMGV